MKDSCKSKAFVIHGAGFVMCLSGICRQSWVPIAIDMASMAKLPSGRRDRRHKLPLGKAGAVCQYVWQVCDDGIIR